MKLTILAFMILVIIFVPLVNIWALNTLFPVLAIPYTFKTWLATAILSSVVAARSVK